MLSQWRSKRHFPMDAGPSVIPNSSSRPTSPNGSFSPRSSSSRSMRLYRSSSRSNGLKAAGKVAIGKGAKFRPGTRDSSRGTPSPMSFAAGPRSSSRAGHSLEYGRGVVPDDAHSDADHSDSSESPVTPSRLTSTSTDRASSTAPNLKVSASSDFPSTANGAQHDQTASHARLESSGTRSSLEDFRCLLSFSSPSSLHDESPALTTSTSLSTPEFAATFATSSSKPSPASYANKPQPPIPISDEPAASPSRSSKNASQGQKAVRTPSNKMSLRSKPVGEDESRRRDAQTSTTRRPSYASSLPKSVSRRGSSSYDNEEPRSSKRRPSISEAMRMLEESVERGPEGVMSLGLGISNSLEARRTASTSSSRANTTLHRADSLSTRRHTNSSSEMSSRSSTDSWRRGSIGRDILRMLIDSEQLDDTPTTASSSKMLATRISDGGHSSATADTSTDLHDSDQLATIKERIEAPEIALQRQMSLDLGLSPSQTASLFEPIARKTSTHSESDEIHLDRTSGRLHDLDEAQEPVNTDQQSSLVTTPATQGEVVASPAIGVQPRKASQASIAKELRPALTHDDPTSRSRDRRPSNTSSIRSRKGASERSHDAGPRRSSDVLTTMTTPVKMRSTAEPSTTPLPSLPFTESTIGALLQPNWSWSTAQAAEANTPHAIYQAELAKAVGKPRKGRPAALALNHAALSSFSPGGSVSAGNMGTFKGLASPGGMRAPPPSAPPAEPLPPVPDSASIILKSPMVGQRRGSAAAAAAKANSMLDGGGDVPRTPRVPRHISSATDLRVRDRASGLESASAGLLNGLPTDEQNLFSVANAKPSETGIRTRKASVAATSAVPPVMEESSAVKSPAVVLTDEQTGSVATSAVARLAGCSVPQAVRFSVGKNDRKSQEATKTAASAVAATEHADGHIASPKSKPIAMAKTEEVSPRSSPVALPKDKLTNVKAPARRAVTADKSSRPPPSAWNGRKAVSASHAGTAKDVKGSSELGHERQDSQRDGAESAASCHSNASCISDRRREILADREALLGALSEPSRQAVLERTESRFVGAFGEVSRAFRQLQADKMLLEQIVREKTPLSGSGDNNELLSGHLSMMNAKLEHNAVETRKLLDLLEKQREVMEQMMATHQLERDTYEADIEHLHRMLDEAEADADHHRSHVLRLNEELTKAHAGMVQANADAMRTRAALSEESRKRKKVVQLLRQAKERLREVETENLASSSSRQSDQRVEDAEIERLSPESHRSTSSESEVAKLRRMLEERDQEIAALRLSHADAMMQQDADDSVSLGHGSAFGHDAGPAEQVARLRAQIIEQREREKQIRTAYVYVREELRKVNSERRRSSVGSAAGRSAPPSAFSAGESARTGRYSELRDPVRDGPDQAGEERKQQVKLKRLSLPIVARASGLVTHSPGSPMFGHDGGPQGRSASPMAVRSPSELAS